MKKDEIIYFETLSGGLEVSNVDNYIEMKFPTKYSNDIEIRKDIVEALNIKAQYVLNMSQCGRNYIVEVKSNILKEIKPIYDKVINLDIEGVSVTSVSDKYDFESRFFAPQPGLIEDPVTGSAHCMLGEYWREKLKKAEFLAYQSSDRGGKIKVKINNDITYLYGKAIKVYEGELFI